MKQTHLTVTKTLTPTLKEDKEETAAVAGCVSGRNIHIWSRPQDYYTMLKKPLQQM